MGGIGTPPYDTRNIIFQQETGKGENKGTIQYKKHHFHREMGKTRNTGTEKIRYDML